jgi:hypothetical protein
VERLGLVWAFTLKENQPELLREAERLTQESPTGVKEEPGREIRYWHLPEVDWPVADRQIRVVKTVRIEQQRRVTVRGKDAARMKGKTAILLPSTNFYATNFELGSISPLFIHQLSRSRWRIDTEVFQTITTVSSQTPRGPPNHRPGSADHDPVSGLYPVPGLLPPPSPQPCPPKMRHLSCAGQALRLLVPRGFAQHQLIEPPCPAFIVSGNLSGCRPDALDAVFFPPRKINRFLPSREHSNSLPRFLAGHNQSQISRVIDRQMALYGTADPFFSLS